MNYPVELRRSEIEAIEHRRKKARLSESTTPAVGGPGGSPSDELPDDVVGLALSGGGIRSATLCLGVLQSLAKCGRLRRVDFASTVSGGGYTGSFLGRLFTRKLVKGNEDPCGRVQAILADNQSPQIDWLRRYANYIFNGDSDMTEGYGVLWRNLTTIYLVLLFSACALFALFRIGGHAFTMVTGMFGIHAVWGSYPALAFSAWWPLPVLLLVLAVTPASLAYWLAPGPQSKADFSFYSLLAWVVLFAGFGAGLSLTDAPAVCAVAMIILLASLAWLEVVRSHIAPREAATILETTIQNRLTRALGKSIEMLLWTTLWVALDTLARTLAEGRLVKLIVVWGAMVTPALPFLRSLAAAFSKPATPAKPGEPASSARGWTGSPAFRAGLIAFPLAGFLVVVVDAGVHWVFNHKPSLGMALAAICGFGAFAVGHAFQFLNASSLQASYAARLCRTFLGASNPGRFRAGAGERGCNVTVVHRHDDVSFEDYHPEESGGPLHLIGICVNETIDEASQRDVPDSKGLGMCVGPRGVSVGRNFHALWTAAPEKLPMIIKVHRLINRLPVTRDPRSRPALKAITRAGNLFHVLKGKSDAPIMVERLSLGTWTAISGAAFGTGTGRTTSRSQSLLCGLANLRLGYWWNSRLRRSQRPGCYPASPGNHLRHWPTLLAPMQSLLLGEFQGRFAGPSHQYWNLSDGGFFDNTALYELLRRRVPFMIAADASHDPASSFDDLAELIRKARTDFAAAVEFVDNPQACLVKDVPPRFAQWIVSDAVGTLAGIRAGKFHSALAKVTYNGGAATSWLLYLKSSLTGDEPPDIDSYKQSNSAFPHDPTTSQFFSEIQWESYRMLGEHIGASVIK